MKKSDEPGKTRVAAYVRIGGSGQCDQILEVHTRYYQDWIGRNPEWEFAGVYADIGPEMKDRPELKHLIYDCEARRVGLIVTKNTSRISRSIHEIIKIAFKLRYLKRPVGIYFETENMNTLSDESFLLLTLMEIIAIEESKHKNDALPYIYTQDQVKR